MFKKILVANRGEIAVRVIRACQELSIPTVAVFSDVDRGGLPVQMADEAVHIGPPSPLESYLNVQKIVETAQNIGADAIHPGYGFLAENHLFANEVLKAGMTFIGPPAEAIRLMGNKVESRARMIDSGVPVTPGSALPPDDVDGFMQEAENIGYPVLVKAAAGGGGKGMRVVNSSKELRQSLESAQREAGSAFGDSTVYLEKYIERPRHVEFQILADEHGNVVHLFERECSIQRRHQKIVEETPSVALTPELREKMGATAVQSAQAVGYTNAGTVEFLLDPTGNFYFLEMNTRIQVEHPVTEFVTGIDLVQWQIRIAAGEALSFRQQDLQQTGHSIECRIYAEDPSNNFMPSPGVILFSREASGPGVRNDSAIFSGYEVTTHYDPILSKLITWGENREHARNRMIIALEEMVVLGIQTTTEYLSELLQHQAFIDGQTYTDFIPTNMAGWLKEKSMDEQSPEQRTAPLSVLAAAGLDTMNPDNNRAGRGGDGVDHGAKHLSPWQQVGNWQVGDHIPQD